MAGVPLKPEYGPTLGQLLSPSWRSASRATRLIVACVAAASIVAVAALVLTLLPSRLSYGGPVPFAFSYRGLYRTAPDPGGYAKVQLRRGGGRLEDSFAVGPLRLPPYRGSLSGELPLYAAGYVKALAAKYRGFELEGEGKTKINAGVGYDVYYRAHVAGRTMYGRDLLLLPERAGAREGVTIVMLSLPHADPQVTSPQLLATAGVLYEPLRTFSFR
jgi:hypothetical protein